jgi:hypothetical protein
MNENFKAIMDSIRELKAAFSATAQSFNEAVLEDGTQLSYEGELVVGTAVFVVTETEQVPAPEGTHALGGEMAGISIVVDANGIVTEVIDTTASATNDLPVTEETSSEFEAISADILPQVLEGVTEVIAEKLGLEMDLAYDVASAVIARINEDSETAIPEVMSAVDVDAIVNAKLQSFSAIFEGLTEMIKTVASENESLRSEVTELKGEFNTFKAAPSNNVTETEKFARVTSTLTTRQLFLKNNINK